MNEKDFLNLCKKVAKLTPCKKPEVAGSAGHCEPGVGRFTDPHPFTCCKITPRILCSMLSQCRPPTALSKPVLRVEENSVFNQCRSVLHSVAFAGPPGPAFFFFCLSPVSLNRLFLSGDETSFLSAEDAAALGFVHNRLTRPQRGRSGAFQVSFPYPVL